MIETMTPSGVEQSGHGPYDDRKGVVIETMTPSGVEQFDAGGSIAKFAAGDRDDDAFGR